MKTLTQSEWERTPEDYRSERFGVRSVLCLDGHGATVLEPVSVLDERDATILADRGRQLDAVAGPRCGDFVRFADGRLERVSHVWDWEPEGVQTSEGGSWYLGGGYCSFSGGLNPSIPLGELTLTDERRLGSCWFFHHDWAEADNSVGVELPFRVYDVAGVREIIRSSTPYTRPEWFSDYIAGETVAPVRVLS
jgi:hypothetical protein